MSYEDEIISALSGQKLVLFTGSGISRDAELPDWSGLTSSLKNELVKGKQLPSEYAGPIDSLIEKGKLIDALQLMLSGIPRKSIMPHLRRILTTSKTSSTCETIGKMKLRGIVTTNYDRVLDQFMPHDLYRLNNSIDKLAMVSTALGSGHMFLLKLHGDIDDELDPLDPMVGQGAGFIVLSRSDYVALMQGRRRESLVLALHSILDQCSVLFVGYSFSDPDVDWAMHFLAECCRFSNSSWFVTLRGGRQPSLPTNVIGISPIDKWDELGGWLGSLHEAMRKSSITSAEAQAIALEKLRLSDEIRKSYIAIGRYLSDLESPGLAERVLAAALLEEISNKPKFNLEWLALKIADFAEVGPGLARALASATARYLSDIGLIDMSTASLFTVAHDHVETLQKRAFTGWERDKESFYRSIMERLGASKEEHLDGFYRNLDMILQNLCINYGQSMAEWVHRGIGKELGWQRAKDLVDTYFSDKEEARKAKIIFEMLLAKPTDAEIPYLYRLLGAAFLSNSVRLDPLASKAVRTTFASYELFLDSNILLPLLIKEHDDYSTMAAIIEDTRSAGVRLFVLQCLFDEVRAHLDIAKRTVSDYEGDLSMLAELVTIAGKRANCFIQGYINSLNTDEIEGGKSASTASLKWDEYCSKYAPLQLGKYLKDAGIVVVPEMAYQHAKESKDYGPVLTLIKTEWERKSYGYTRAPILNQTEAVQFCHIYHRRQEMKISGSPPEIWFLSFETVLSRVFERNASKWGLPPTFPFSAWVAFLDSRISLAPKNPAAIVNAILKGNSDAFDLPDAIALVRKKAFGDKVPTKIEESALQFEMSSFSLIKQIEHAKVAILSRGDHRQIAKESKAAKELAIGEISKELRETVRRLEKEIAKQKELIQSQASKSEKANQTESPKPQPGSSKSHSITKGNPRLKRRSKGLKY